MNLQIATQAAVKLHNENKENITTQTEINLNILGIQLRAPLYNQ